MLANLKLTLKDKYSRTIFFTKLAVLYNVFMAAAKIFLGIFSVSFFICAFGFYNLGIGLAKACALKAHYETARGSDSEKNYGIQQKYYMIIGGIIVISGVMYMIYCGRMLFGEGAGLIFTQLISLVIPGVTFLEMLFSVRGALSARKMKNPIMESIKLTSLASTLICVVLTQISLLALVTEQDMTYYNGLSGLIFGSLASIVGIYMLVRSIVLNRAHKKTNPGFKGVPFEKTTIK